MDINCPGGRVKTGAHISKNLHYPLTAKVNPSRFKSQHWNSQEKRQNNYFCCAGLGWGAEVPPVPAARSGKISFPGESKAAAQLRAQELQKNQTSSLTAPTKPKKGIFCKIKFLAVGFKESFFAKAAVICLNGCDISQQTSEQVSWENPQRPERINPDSEWEFPRTGCAGL